MELRPPPPMIDGSRVVLRRHEESLAATMFEYIDRDRERLARFLPWPPMIKTVGDELAYLQDTLRQWTACTLFDFGIFRKEDALYMGNLGVHTIAWESRRCELGYWILGDFEGRGYMGEAIIALESALFELGFQCLEIRCDALNQRSAKLPQRLGYTLEATLRTELKESSSYRDTMVFTKGKPNNVSLGA